MRELGKAYKIMIAKTDGKRPFGISRCRGGDNILRGDIMEMGCELV
jgi:hypothetical protein